MSAAFGGGADASCPRLKRVLLTDAVDKGLEMAGER